MAYGDESLCEKSNCDGKKAILRKTKKKTKNILNIFRVSTPT